MDGVKFLEVLEVRLNKYIKSYGFLFAVAGPIILLDQLTKQIIRQNLAFEEIWTPWHWLIPYARIVHWQNYGAAFGMFQNGNLVFTILAIIVSSLIIYYFPRIDKDDWLLRLALGFQLGGAVGNLIDRLSQGYVTDFISVGSFPVFNIADASITIGAVLLVISVWFKDQTPEEQTEANTQVQELSNPAAKQPIREIPAPTSREEHADE